MFQRPFGLVLLALSLSTVAPLFAQTVGPPIASGSGATAVAVNPITNRIYIANESSLNVTVVDGATFATTLVPVGSGPVFIAVNPTTNKIYVNNEGDGSLSVIDGATNAVATYPIGSFGPITINPVTNKVYVVRQGNADEVTTFDGATNTWYSIATNSFSAVAAAINPLTNTLYVAHYPSGDIRIIDASSTDDFPPSAKVPVSGNSKYLAINPATNRIYVITDTASTPIAVIDGATNSSVEPVVPSGHGVGARAVAVNPATNKIYAAFANEVIVVDGATNAMTFIPSNDSGGPVAVGIDALTNKIYVPNGNGTLMIIDGDTNAVTTLAIPPGARSIGVNPVTNTMYIAGPSGVSPVDGSSADTVHGVGLTTTITPLAGNSGGPNPTLTLNASSSLSPIAPPVRAVYFQVDDVDRAWNRASGSGPYSAALSGLANGTHTLYAYATDSQDAPSVTVSPQSAPFVGNIASYTFIVTGGAVAPPGAPQSLSGVVGNGQATFTFSPPTSNGGAAISGYTVTCGPGGLSVSGSASPLTLDGLANGTRYTCVATATNSAGTGPASASVVVTPAASSLAFVAAKSRKTHDGQGAFDIEIDPTQPIGGSITVEPRVNGGTHKIVFEFNSAISTTGTPSCVDAASHSVGSVSAVAVGSTVEVNISGVSDATRITVGLTDVSGQGLDVHVSLGLLVGDVDSSGAVTASDILRVKGRVGQTARIWSFTHDVDLSGGIDAADVSATKAQAGLQL